MAYYLLEDGLDRGPGVFGLVRSIFLPDWWYGTCSIFTCTKSRIKSKGISTCYNMIICGLLPFLETTLGALVGEPCVQTIPVPILNAGFIHAKTRFQQLSCQIQYSYSKLFMGQVMSETPLLLSLFSTSSAFTNTFLAGCLFACDISYSCPKASLARQ
jgi:hypothetical protein